MKKLFILLMLTLTLFSDTSYPELFSELGTPLYEADESFSKLPLGHDYATAVDDYHKHQLQALQLSRSEDKKAYFSALRELAKEHDAIIAMLKREIITAMNEDAYAYFISINDVGINALYLQESFKDRIYLYYHNNKAKGKSAYLDESIRSEKGYQKLYGSDISSSSQAHKNVILISRPGCGWCDKAKAFMRSNNISFTEHNVQTSAIGKKLYKKHNASGVPLIIIGDSVIRGYNESSILNAL